MLILLIVLSLPVFAQVLSIERIVDVLENPQEKISPESYRVQCVEEITFVEWNQVIESAKMCTLADIHSCFKFCSKILETKFDFKWSELNEKLVLAGLPKSNDLCTHTKPSLEMASLWLEKKCPLSLKKSVFKPSELYSYSLSLKDNSNYRMKDPKGLCRERAYLLAEDLVSQGYTSKLTRFTTDTQGSGFKVLFNGQNYDYDHHWAVLITDSSGNEQIIDPQFIDNSLNLKDYLKLISPQVPVKVNQTNFHYLVKYLEPSDIEKSCEQLEKEIHSQTLEKIAEN